MRVRHILTGLAVVISLSGACNKGKDAAPSAPDVWAVVDGHEIRQADVEKAYRRLPQQAAPTSDQEKLSVQFGLLDELISQEVLLARARALHLDPTPAEIDAAFAERKGNMTEEAFQQELKARDLTPDDMKQASRDQLLIQKLLDRDVVSKVAVSDQEVSDFYAKNRAQFNIPETQYRIAQIVVTPTREAQIRNRMNDDAATPADAAKKAQMLMDRLKAGTAFGDLAMDFSEDAQTAPQGGDLGFVPASALERVPAPLRDAVLKLEPGKVQAVSAGGAYTLVLLVSRETAGQRELSTPGVRESITSNMRDQREQLLRTAYVTDARSQAKIVNHLARKLVEGQGKPPGLAPAAPGK